MSKRDAEIYRKAALLISNGVEQYSCHAVHKASGVPIWVNGQFNYETCEHTVRYCEEMLDDDDAPLSVRLHDDWDLPIKDLRVLLLCMMAAISEDE